MRTIRDRVEAVRSRQQRQWLWQTLSIGLVIGGLLGSVFGVARLLGAETLSLVWIAAVIVACPLVGIGCGRVSFRKGGFPVVEKDPPP